MHPLKSTTASLALVFVILGCAGSFGDPSARMVCTSDEQCAENQVCFADGCGDPGKNVVVEVTGDPQLGFYAQDFAVDVAATLDFDMLAPVALLGSFQRSASDIIDPTNLVSYGETVQVRAVGQSLLIPGVSRSYEEKFARPERGFFSMNLGSGKYAVTALPADRSVPPLTQQEVTVDQGLVSSVSFIFPSLSGSALITGRVVKKVGALGGAGVISEGGVDLQAFDPVTRQALSQRVQVSSGFSGSDGSFVVALHPAVMLLRTVQLVVTPRDTSALVPGKSFILETPLANGITLEMGDYGAPLLGLGATVEGDDGKPLAGVQVVFEALAAGGGQFRSKTALTDAAGHFSVDLLPPSDGTSYQVTLIPAPGASSAVTQLAVKLKSDLAQPSLSDAVLRCERRIEVKGQVLRPDGRPSVDVRVRAVDLSTTTLRPLPLEDVETLTDETGHYTLFLDPGSWRLDFRPSDDSAAAARLLTLKPQSNILKEEQTLELVPLTLPRSRKVTGVVTSQMGPRSGQTMPYAGLRFFRVTSVEGKASATLLGQTVADQSGRYSVVLPTR